MAIDKALYQAPIGIDEAAEMEEPLDIEIEIEDYENDLSYIEPNE